MDKCLGTSEQLIHGSRCCPNCDDRKEAIAGRSHGYDAKLADAASAQSGRNPYGTTSFRAA